MERGQEVLGKIKHYFIDELAANEEQLQSTNSSLIEGGILDSFTILKVASFLEKEFKIQPTPMDLTLDNFETLEKLTEFTCKKMQL